MSDIDTAVVDSLKVLDLKRPIREGDMAARFVMSALPSKADIRRLDCNSLTSNGHSAPVVSHHRLA